MRLWPRPAPPCVVVQRLNLLAHRCVQVTLRPVLVGPRNGPPDTWPMRSFGQTRFAATSRTADSARQRVCVVRQPNSPDAIAYLTGEAGALGPELTRNKVLFTTSSQDPSLGLRHQRQDGWIVAYVHYTHVCVPTCTVVARANLHLTVFCCVATVDAGHGFLSSYFCLNTGISGRLARTASVPSTTRWPVRATNGYGEPVRRVLPQGLQIATRSRPCWACPCWT